MRSIRTALVLVLVLALVVGACSADGGGGGGGVGTAGGALAALPDPGGHQFTVVFTNLDRAAAAAGIEAPPAGASQQDQSVFLLRVTGVPGDPGDDGVAGGLVPSSMLDLRFGLVEESLEDAVGIHLADIDAFAELQVPPENLVVLTGTFDTGAIGGALGAQPDDDGFVVLGEEGQVDGDERGVLRGTLGLGVVVAASSSRLVVARTADLARGATGAGARLADDDALAAVARALDDEHAYAGGLDRPEGQPFAARATGIADGPDGPVLVVAFAYGEDTAAAQAHAEALRTLVTDDGERWAERLVDADVQVVDGIVVLRATLTDRVYPTIWYEVLAGLDPIVTAPSSD